MKFTNPVGTCPQNVLTNASVQCKTTSVLNDDDDDDDDERMNFNVA